MQSWKSFIQLESSIKEKRALECCRTTSFTWISLLYLDEEIPLPPFVIKQERDAYKILRYSDGGMALKNDDEKYALWVYRNNGKFYQVKFSLKRGRWLKLSTVL